MVIHVVQWSEHVLATQPQDPELILVFPSTHSPHNIKCVFVAMLVVLSLEVCVTVCLPLQPLSEDLLSCEEHEAGQGRGEAKTVSFIHLTSMIHQQQFLRDK